MPKKSQEADVIDLNIVLHSEEDDENETEGQSESEGETSLGGDNGGVAHNETGLVCYLDDIPEEEFMKMISGGDVAITSSSLTASNSPDDVTETSHDPCDDVTGESHDPCDDVTGESHDRGLLALILTPTRELALQIQHHIRDAAKHTHIKVCCRNQDSAQNGWSGSQISLE